jgi:transcriptional regulator with XRE-family HTH domain
MKILAMPITKEIFNGGALMTTIGSRIRQRRKDKGMNQNDLADLIGIEGPSLNQIELGRTKMPRPTTLVKLAEILETNIPWLLTGEGDPDARDAITNDADAMARFERLAPEHKAAIKAMIVTFQNLEAH